jgi:hypothetical protein
MERYLKRVAAATLAFLGLGVAAPALASPVHVTIGTPKIVVSPPVFGLSIVAPRPSPDFVWVSGTWRRDAFGRQIWVPGYWHNPRSAVIVRSPAPAPAPVHTVTVIRR